VTAYGKKGGEGPTRGKSAIKYGITLPDGTKVTKRVFRDLGEQATATAFRRKDGGIEAVVWSDKPAWEGDFGILVAERCP